ncbi:MAG: hypothetical protein WDA16_06490 [Candidatus Thermoplasmatota archaeon]
MWTDDQAWVLVLMAEPSPRRRFLIVDDSDDIRWVLVRLVQRGVPHARVQDAPDASAALDALHDAGDGDGLTVISDYDMGLGATGVELLAEVARRHPRAKRVLFTGHALSDIGPVASQPDHVLSKDGGLLVLRKFLAEA